jgi:hypothetical protein
LATLATLMTSMAMARMVIALWISD